MRQARAEKAKEIRSLAKNFTDLAEVTTLDDYKDKLHQAATRLLEAADALESGVESICA